MRAIMILSLMALSGCANNLTFYQSTRASLTVESSGVDVTKPVQGTFGYRNRTFIHNPRIGGDDSDVMSLIGNAEFNVEDKATGSDLITFRTALISGDAASELKAPELKQAVQAVSAAKVVPGYSDLAKKSKTRMCSLSAKEYTQSKKLITSTPYDDLTDDDKKKLGNQTGAGLGSYTSKLHDELSSYLKSDGDC